MTAVVGRAWGWVRSWGGKPGTQQVTQATVIAEEKKPSRGWTSWLWFGWSHETDLNSPVEEFWEAPEKIQPLEVEELKAGKDETDGSQPRWWNRLLPTYYIHWPKTAATTKQQQRKRKESDTYRTPPPSPTPPIASPFRLFVSSWKLEITPEHYDICFNFLRHLFDLFVVGFLWTVSTPSKIVLEILGVQGGMRLWCHGMAMFVVAIIGMAGLLGLIREYLAQFMLVYGIIQALVISVSVKQSVLFGGIEEEQKKEEEAKEKLEVKKDTKELRGGLKPLSPKEKRKKIS